MKNQLLESDMQKSVADYLRKCQPDVLFCATNGGIIVTIPKYMIEKWLRKAFMLGYNPGIPDIVIFEARGGFHGYHLELKRSPQDKLRDEQKIWFERLKKRNYKVERADSIEESIDKIKSYLAL